MKKIIWVIAVIMSVWAFSGRVDAATTVKLTSDQNDTYNCESSSQNIEIDLCGHSLKGGLFVDGGTVKIKDSVGGGTISGITLDDGNLTMNSGKVTGSVYIRWGIFTLNGGSITADENYAVYIGDARYGGLTKYYGFEMNGGSVTSKEGAAVAIDTGITSSGYKRVVINNGILKGKFAISGYDSSNYEYGGSFTDTKLLIYGGKFYSNSNEIENNRIENGALNIDSASNVYIYGGEFFGPCYIEHSVVDIEGAVFNQPLMIDATNYDGNKALRISKTTVKKGKQKYALNIEYDEKRKADITIASGNYQGLKIEGYGRFEKNVKPQGIVAIKNGSFSGETLIDGAIVNIKKGTFKDIYIENNTKVQINNGKYKGKITSEGTLTIKKGQFNKTLYTTKGGKTIIKKGTFKGIVSVAYDGANLKISKGTFKKGVYVFGDGKLSISGGTFYGTKRGSALNCNLDKDYKKLNVVLSGGIFKGKKNMPTIQISGLEYNKKKSCNSMLKKGYSFGKGKVNNFKFIDEQKKVRRGSDVTGTAKVSKKK